MRDSNPRPSPCKGAALPLRQPPGPWATLSHARLGDNGEYLFRPTRLIFRNWVPSQKPARLKVAGRRTQSDRFFCRAENFLKDSEFLNVRAVVRCRAVMSDLTDIEVSLKTSDREWL